jgi:hypothetical protein
MGPIIDVTQDATDGDEGIAASVDNVKNGRVTVNQKTRNVKRSIGFEGGDIGPTSTR